MKTHEISNINIMIDYLCSFYIYLSPTMNYFNESFGMPSHPNVAIFIDYINTNCPNSTVDNKFKFVKRLFKSYKKNINYIIDGEFVIDYYRGHKHFWFSSIDIEINNYLFYECSICGEQCMDKDCMSCDRCVLNGKSMCRYCKIQHVKAKIEMNTDVEFNQGCGKLDIKCLCDNKTLFKTFGSQNGAQYGYLLNYLDFNIIKTPLKIWRFNMVSNYINSTSISQESKVAFAKDQKNILAALLKDDPSIVARNCPKCSVVIVKPTGCNAVVCMNKNAGCTAKFCIACGKCFTLEKGGSQYCDCKNEGITNYYFERNQLEEQRNGRTETSFNKKNYIVRNLAK
jgi:hypothetical protein